MRAVWSFWSRPHSLFYHRFWHSERAHLLCWALSVARAAAHFQETCLVTDCAGARLLVDELGLPFTTVSDDLERLNQTGADPQWWVLGKLSAYAAQLEPFLHIDADAILWKPLPAHLAGAAVIAQNPEHFDLTDQTLYRADQFIRGLADCGGWLPDEWQSYAAQRRTAALCCGILGGTDINFLHRYARRATEIILHPRNAVAWERIGIRDNILVEQYFLAACLEAEAIRGGPGPASRVGYRLSLSILGAGIRSPECRKGGIYSSHRGCEGRPRHRRASGAARPGRASRTLRALHAQVRGERFESSLSTEARMMGMQREPDADQKAAFKAVQSQGRLCLDHIRSMAAPNGRIAGMAQSGGSVWSRVAATGYDQVCRDRQRPAGGMDDVYLSAIRGSADLKLVCDGRWVLGEAVDVLRDRLAGLDTIAEPYDDFERCVRRSITGTDRSPAELAAGIEQALALGTRAVAWELKRPEADTRVERWKRKLQDNPAVAAIMILGIAVAGIATVYNALPAEFKEWLGLVSKPGP